MALLRLNIVGVVVMRIGNVGLASVAVLYKRIGQLCAEEMAQLTSPNFFGIMRHETRKV